MCRLLFQLCPDAMPASVSSASHSCQFEGLFSDVAKPSKEPFLPILFHCVSEILSEVCNKFASAANAGKTPSSSLPFKKHPLDASSDPQFGKVSPLNPSLARIVGSLAGSRSSGVQFHEIARMEAISRQLLEPQSVSFWLFNALLNWLKQENFVPSDAVLFEELAQAFSLSMVGCTSSLALLATFCQVKRREAVLSHFPSHIGLHFHSSMASSSFIGPYLFDDKALLRVLAASREDSAVSANVALVKAVSFPVFGAGKSDRKVYSDRSSSAASRGRGRGSVSDRFRKASASSSAYSSSQDRKRKSTSPAGKSSKSPRCSLNNPRGKGFRK